METPTWDIIKKTISTSCSAPTRPRYVLHALSVPSSFMVEGNAIDINVYYDPKKPTPSTDHRHGSKTVTTFSLTGYSSRRPHSLLCATDIVTGKLGDFRSDMSPCPPFFSPSLSHVNLPRLRELDDIFPPAAPSNSTTYSLHPIGSCESFPRSATFFSETRRSMPLATYGYHNSLPLSKTTLQYQYGLQDLSLIVGGCLPDWLPVRLHTGATTSRRPRRSTSRPHCNVRYTPEQVGCIDYLRDNCGLSWREVAEKYASIFPGDAEQGHERGAQGLQGVYYRKNRRMSIHAHKRQCESVGMSLIPLGNPNRTDADDNEDAGRARQWQHEATAHQKKCKQAPNGSRD
ncbi:hypothetical protein CDEST_01937 [Colletotrichum destructivum]|uniref:Myb-like domain-containing protein n=1 Tax=Colletotrichum destructivum TaxID=34406 RepID=A0AAX4I0J8_9PEZI|nr:hypothetical protein CDEST_01937 [Colletotrichum destructivum]